MKIYSDTYINRNIGISNVKNDRTKIVKAYKIADEAFQNLSYLKFYNVSTTDNVFLIHQKDNAEKTLGCYILQYNPDKSEIKISTAALLKEYRNTKTGYNAILSSWNKILDCAKANKVEYLTLDVFANNKNLIKMYKQLGFNIYQKKYSILDNEDYYKMFYPLDKEKSNEIKTKLINNTIEHKIISIITSIKNHLLNIGKITRK